MSARVSVRAAVQRGGKGGKVRPKGNGCLHAAGWVGEYGGWREHGRAAE